MHSLGIAVLKELQATCSTPCRMGVWGKEEGETQGKHTAEGLSPFLINWSLEVCRSSIFNDTVGG